ncbi:hypothetical protein [Bacillus luti]|uniref:hypothetical protein n=1 Tax=Bacillus luti TaxID=2026191 RepID=UPI0028990C3B|nr:hypothetical protein [Bacillus luti]
MNHILNAVDIEDHIGEVTLSNGNKLLLPKIGMKKIIAIVKFIGVDGLKLWDKASKIMIQTDLDTFSKFALVIDSLEDEQLVKIQSILLGISEQEALKLDLNETLDVFIQYAEKTNVGKTYSQIQHLTKVMFKKELPNFGDLLDRWFPKKESNLEEMDQLIKEAQLTPTVPVTNPIAVSAGQHSANN